MGNVVSKSGFRGVRFSCLELALMLQNRSDTVAKPMYPTERLPVCNSSRDVHGLPPVYLDICLKVECPTC